MKVTELRIGNWIQDGNEFEQITIDHLNCLNSGRCEYDPIPLTEEWLLKFGFIKGNYNWFRLYFNPEKLEDSDCLTYNINSKMLCLESFYDNEKKGSIQLSSRDEKYVHQLQNLYFALTSEELTIKQQEQ
jgi:hypothetical protein